MGGTPDLTEVPVHDLLEEVQRRMLCSLKPQKRVILIGKQFCMCAKRFRNRAFRLSSEGNPFDANVALAPLNQ